MLDTLTKGEHGREVVFRVLLVFLRASPTGRGAGKEGLEVGPVRGLARWASGFGRGPVHVWLPDTARVG